MPTTAGPGTRWLCLPPRVDSPSRSREFVRGALDEWLLRELVDDAVLLVSELASNAVVHARTGMVIGANWSPAAGILRVCVLDDDDGQPVPRHAASTDTSGRGLEMVDLIAWRWGVIHGVEGKSVWFELHMAA